MGDEMVPAKATFWSRLLRHPPIEHQTCFTFSAQRNVPQVKMPHDQCCEWSFCIPRVGCFWQQVSLSNVIQLQVYIKIREYVLCIPNLDPDVGIFAAPRLFSCFFFVSIGDFCYLFSPRNPQRLYLILVPIVTYPHISITLSKRLCTMNTDAFILCTHS